MSDVNSTIQEPQEILRWWLRRVCADTTTLRHPASRIHLNTTGVGQLAIGLFSQQGYEVVAVSSKKPMNTH